MASTTVRISEESRETLRQLSEELDEPMQKVLDRALEAYRRRVLLEKANEAFAALRADPKAWAEEERERAEWRTA
ncbi:MAG: toxin-antitoxin system protein [Chloroflexi bacterium]|nr:toxin-antitoxin system protein [Chloroflexota bacterium]